MASYTAADVKRLRELTGAGMLDCKNALADSDAELADIGGAALERAADALGDARPGIPAIARQITAAVRGLMGR